MSRRISIVVTLALAAAAISGARAAPGTASPSDPSLANASDPHGAIKAMSKASEPAEKSDHSVTKVPDLVPSGPGSTAGVKAPRP